MKKRLVHDCPTNPLPHSGLSDTARLPTALLWVGDFLLFALTLKCHIILMMAASALSFCSMPGRLPSPCSTSFSTCRQGHPHSLQTPCDDAVVSALSTVAASTSLFSPDWGGCGPCCSICLAWWGNL